MFSYVSFMMFFHLSVLSSEINREKIHYYTVPLTKWAFQRFCKKSLVCQQFQGRAEGTAASRLFRDIFKEVSAE